MEFFSIFDLTESSLWAVCYPEDNPEEGGDYDIFCKLFDQWNDTEYLDQFFEEHKDELNDSFWQGMSREDAVKQIEWEAAQLEEKLRCIDAKLPACKGQTLNDIFIPLHQNIYSIRVDNEQHRKGRLRIKTPMLRLYALQLDDGTMVITGGGIKLTEKMEGDLNDEKRQLTRVQNYLKEQGIADRAGLTG
jgi:hypothetical protein